MSDHGQPPKSTSLLRSAVAGIGILIMSCSGLCSAIVGVSSLFGSDGVNLDGLLTLLGAMAVYGGVPFAVGYGLWRHARTRPRDSA